MPRGVSQRKGAPAVKKQAPVRAAKKLAAPLAPSDDVQAQLPAAIELPPATQPAPPAIEQAPPEPTPAPARRPGRGAIDDMSGDRLKAYARSIGITQRNVDFLTEERLRQNCKARVYESMED